MEKILETYFAGLKVGRKQFYKNMAVYPLLSSYDAGFEYLLLDEALTQGLIEVVEISNQGLIIGSRPRRSRALPSHLRSEFCIFPSLPG
jgi:hypothetical protein